MINRYRLVLLLLLISALTQAQKPADFLKEIDKTYDSLSNETLVIFNRYGNVEVRTWTQPGIKIHVAIVSWAPSLELAKMLSDGITIKYKRSDKAITCSTAISLLKGVRNIKCEVNYTVYLPTSRKLKIVNDFGDITLGDYTGNLAIWQRGGTLKAGKLSGVVNFFLQQGNANIQQLQGGLLTAKAFHTISIGSIKGALSLYASVGDSLTIGLKGAKSNLSAYINQVLVNFYCAANLSAAIHITTGSFSEINNMSQVPMTRKKVLVKGRKTIFFDARHGTGQAKIAIYSRMSTVNFSTE